MPGNLNLSLTVLDIAVCLVATFGSMALGIWMSMRIHAGESGANFFLAGRKLTWPLIGASFYATNIGAEHLVGLSGDAYRYGICASTVEFSTALCLGFAIAVLFPYYLKNKVFTVSEFLEIRYNHSARMIFSGLMLVISIMTKMAFTLFAGALVMNAMLGWDIMKVIVMLAIVSAIVTFVGGFAAVAFTDFIQTVIMIVGCGIMLIIGLHKVGGWEGLVAAVPAKMAMAQPYTNPDYPFWGVIAGAIYGGTFYWGVDQVNVQRVLGAPSLKQAQWGANFAILLKLTPVFIFALPGVIAYAITSQNGTILEGDQAKQTFVWLLNNLLPSGIRGLVLAALLAALISSLDGVMNSVSTMVVRDFVMQHRPNTSEKSQVWIGRLAIIAATILGIGAAILVYKTPGGLYKYLQTISIYLVMPITPAIIFGIMSKRVTLAGAGASVIIGLALAVVYVTDQLLPLETAQQVFPFLHHTLTLNYAYRGFWGFLIIVAVLFGVSAFSKKTDPEKLARTTMTWDWKWEPFDGLKDWRLQLAALLAVTVACYAWFWD